MKLINVDEVKFQKGVFVNPRTNEPLPIIHKVVTIEQLKYWQEEIKAISIEEIKLLRYVLHDYYLQCDTAEDLLEFIDGALLNIIKNHEEE